MLLALSILLACSDKPEDTERPRPPLQDDTDPSDDTAPTETGETASPLSDSALRFAKPPKNLIWIGVDTLRRDRVGRYYESASTPNLDAILSEGVALDDHRACSNWTFGASLCAASGRSQIELGYAPSSSEIMPEDLPMLAEVLADRGYLTSLVTSNSFIGSATGYSDRFKRHFKVSSTDATEATTRAIEEAEHLTSQDKPWFLQVHWMEPHLPYNPPDEWVDTTGLPEVPYDITQTIDWNQLAARWHELSEEEQADALAHIEAHYAGAVSWWDHQLGVLMDSLREIPGALDDSLVIVWSDHGEQFWEHGYDAHGHSLYLEETGAILGFWALPASKGGPGLEPMVWELPTTHADLYANALRALQIEPESDITGQILNDQMGVDRVRYTMRAHVLVEGATAQSVEQNGWRLIARWDGDVQLYDLNTDPGETMDLYEKQPEIRDELLDLLRPQTEALEEILGIEATGLSGL